MTVQDLMDLLSELPSDMEVRFASQPNYPFEYSIDDAVVVEVENNRTGEETEILYLSEGRQIGYLPGSVSSELGWR